MIRSAAIAAVPSTPPHPDTLAEFGDARDPGAWRRPLLWVILLSATYVFWHLGRGWVPHDEGALGHSAERVLRGELPHRDFIDIYTGGLAYLDAAALWLLGDNLWSLRLVLFAAFVAWVPAVFYVASRFAKPMPAAFVTLVAVVWSVPNYPAPLPSWYNLFLATAGVAALLRHMETGRRRWLVVAGVAGGLSCLIKIVGLYYVAGVLLWAVHASLARSRILSAPHERRAPVYATFVSVCLLAFVAALVSLVRREFRLPEFVQFVVPGALIATLLIRNAWTEGAEGSQPRFAALARLIVPFLAGVLLPVAIFLVPYVQAHAVDSLLQGVFVLPMKRLGFASVPVGPLTNYLALLPVVGILALAMRFRAAPRRNEIVLLSIAVILYIILTAKHPLFYRLVWYAAAFALPALVLVGVLLDSRAPGGEAGALVRQQTMLLLCVTAVCNIVQFPFAVPIYFCYVAPLVVLTALALWRAVPVTRSALPGAVLSLFLVFPVLRANTSGLGPLGSHYEPYPRTLLLTMERGGLQVPAPEAAAYNYLVLALRQHARGGYTWASPDAPEIYYLSGLRNPTRSLFEFFDDSTNDEGRVLRMLDTHGVTAIVLNGRPSFSRGISRPMYEQLRERYPLWQNIGKFQLRWRS